VATQKSLLFYDAIINLDKIDIRAKKESHNILYSTTNQYDTIGVGRASDDVPADSQVDKQITLQLTDAQIATSTANNTNTSSPIINMTHNYS